jgi:hypothetical protein
MGELKDDQETQNRGVPPVLSFEEPQNRKAEESWDLHNAWGGGKTRKRNSILQKALTYTIRRNDGSKWNIKIRR